MRKVLSGPDDPFHSNIAALVRGYEDQIKGEFGRIIGETQTDLTGNASGESNIGDLVCDAMREAAGAQIAFYNSGGIRGNIPKGNITLEQVFTVLPFDNVLMSMNLTGKQVLDVLEQSIDQQYGICSYPG